MPLSGKKEENFEEWYIELLQKSGLTAPSPVKGCSVFSTYCMQIWENIKSHLDSKLKALGFSNYYFPSFIPSEIMKKQEAHYRDFSKELFKVENLDLFLRPTSEMIIYPSVRTWIKSESDLPLKINQYCSIFRWESVKPNLPLIRDNEFLWQENHSFHSTEKEADQHAQSVFDIYKDLIQNMLAIPAFSGMKPPHRMFPGAKTTYALESIMPNLKSVQMATSHSLGQNFSIPLDIAYEKTGQKFFVWQACSGVTTRLIGALAMFHGDNFGLVLPPAIAPVQVTFDGIEPVSLPNISFQKDFPHAVLKGVPIIVTKEFIQRRDTLEKIPFYSRKDLASLIPSLLSEVQSSLHKKYAGKMLSTKNYNEFQKFAKSKEGFFNSFWCGEISCARAIKEETKNSLRVVNPSGKGECIRCGKKAKYSAIFAEAY